MNRIIIFMTSMLLSVSLLAQKALPIQEQEFDNTMPINGVYFEYEFLKKEAHVLHDNSNAAGGYKYEQETISIPQVIIINGASGSTGSGKEIEGNENAYKVTEIAEGALKGALCETLTFDTTVQNIRAIRAYGMAQLSYLTSTTLSLPEGIEEIDSCGLFSGSKGNKMGTKKLVLPSTLTTLDYSSIVLYELDSLVFLGDVPPTCNYEKNGDVFIRAPWIYKSDNLYPTSKDIVVIVPESALSAYQDAPGIGDYFTCLKKGPATALEENEEAVVSQQKKVLRNGRLYILRDGVVYDAQGQKVK